MKLINSKKILKHSLCINAQMDLRKLIQQVVGRHSKRNQIKSMNLISIVFYYVFFKTNY